MDSVPAAHPLEGVLPGDRPYHALARFYAAAGDVARARDLLAEGERNDLALGRTNAAERDWARGTIALAEGRVADAQDLLRRAAAAHVCEICPLPDLARAHDAASDLDAAAAAHERCLATPWPWRYEPDAYELGRALERLGELYERRGDAAKDAAAYTRLLRLWGRADGEPAREARAVRQRLARLGPGERG